MTLEINRIHQGDCLELMHDTIQEGIKNGETAYLPQAETFSKFAKALSK